MVRIARACWHKGKREADVYAKNGTTLGRPGQFQEGRDNIGEGRDSFGKVGTNYEFVPFPG